MFHLIPNTLKAVIYNYDEHHLNTYRTVTVVDTVFVQICFYKITNPVFEIELKTYTFYLYEHKINLYLVVVDNILSISFLHLKIVGWILVFLFYCPKMFKDHLQGL